MLLTIEVLGLQVLNIFSLGDIDILQNPQDVPYLENPNEFTLDASYILKLNDNFSMGVTGRFLMSDVKLQSVDSDSSSASSFAVDISGFFSRMKEPMKTLMEFGEQGLIFQIWDPE